MKTSDLLKIVSVAAMALSVYSTSAVAGGTNRGDNTAATPGPKSTTTTTPAQGDTGRDDMRRGTTRTENIDTPDSASDFDQPGSGSSGGMGSTDDSEEYKGYRSPNSSAKPGVGSAPENADSGYDMSTGNTSGSSTGIKDPSR